MAVKTINTELLQKMFLAGAANLEAKKEFINELNVFPVPDGDTGTNMTLTILSAAKEVKALENPDMVAIAKAISSGSLRGARGNSGVILSQLLRGFTKEIREHKEIDTITLAKACERATATAYKAVMKISIRIRAEVGFPVFQVDVARTTVKYFDGEFAFFHIDT